MTVASGSSRRPGPLTTFAFRERAYDRSHARRTQTHPAAVIGLGIVTFLALELLRSWFPDEMRALRELLLGPGLILPTVLVLRGLRAWQQEYSQPPQRKE